MSQDMERENDDAVETSTLDRWASYNDACRRLQRQPLGWGDWIRCGEPIPKEAST